jgi:hypothetical protein
MFLDCRAIEVLIPEAKVEGIISCIMIFGTDFSYKS